MKVIEKISNLIRKPKKSKILIKSKFGLPTVRVCGVVLVDTATAGTLAGNPTTDFATTNAAAIGPPATADNALAAQSTNSAFPSSAFLDPRSLDLGSSNERIQDIYLKNNNDIKDLIVNLNGVVTIGFGVANEQHESIRISYNEAILDLNALIKIYSFTPGNNIVFAQNSKQKKKYKDILDSMNISSVGVDDLVNFE